MYLKNRCNGKLRLLGSAPLTKQLFFVILMVSFKIIFEEGAYMKKYMVLALIFLLSAGAVFADEYGFSVGGGFSFVFDYTTATMEYPTVTGGEESKKQTIKEFNYGGYFFFDAKYVEFAITLAGGPADITVEYPSAIKDDPSNPYRAEYEAENSFTKNSFNMGFSVLGKYPFQLGPVSLFPLAGIDYIVYLTGTYPKADTGKTNGVGRNVAADFNTLWFKFGGGVDIPVAEKLFVRVEALYGFGLENKFQENGEDEAEAYKGEVDWGWVNGPTVRVGLGYRF
jgi:opacity protein-like surface antigen